MRNALRLVQLPAAREPDFEAENRYREAIARREREARRRGEGVCEDDCVTAYA